jgi:hypothetical protein
VIITGAQIGIVKDIFQFDPASSNPLDFLMAHFVSVPRPPCSSLVLLSSSPPGRRGLQRLHFALL